MKGLIIFGTLIVCVCVIFASIQLNTRARYQIEQTLQENNWGHTLTYTDISHKLFSTTGQLLGVKLYAYPHLSVEKLTVSEITPTKAVLVLHNMDLDVLHTLQRQTDVETMFRTYQPIAHLLERPLHSLLLIGKPMVRMDGKLVISRAKKTAIVDITLNAPAVGVLKIRTFLYPVTDHFTHDLLTSLLQGHISAGELEKLPIAKMEISYTDKGGLKAYQHYLSTLPDPFVAKAKQDNPRLTRLLSHPKFEIKIDRHPFKRTRNRKSTR